MKVEGDLCKIEGEGCSEGVHRLLRPMSPQKVIGNTVIPLLAKCYK